MSDHLPVYTKNFTGPFIENAERFLLPLAGRRLNYIETGVYEGRSAVWMLQNVLTNPDSTYTGIDAYVMGEKKRTGQLLTRAKRNLGPYKSKSRFLQGRSELLLPQLLAENQTYDIGYVDGDHTALGAATDFCYLWRMLKPGGLLAVDDMRHPKFKDIPRVIRAMVALLPCEVLADNAQLWLRKN